MKIEERANEDAERQIKPASLAFAEAFNMQSLAPTSSTRSMASMGTPSGQLAVFSPMSAQIKRASAMSSSSNLYEGALLSAPCAFPSSFSPFSSPPFFLSLLCIVSGDLTNISNFESVLASSRVAISCPVDNAAFAKAPARSFTRHFVRKSASPCLLENTFFMYKNDSASTYPIASIPSLTARSIETIRKSFVLSINFPLLFCFAFFNFSSAVDTIWQRKISRICFNVAFLVDSSTRFSNAATRNTANPHAAAKQSFFLNFDAKPTLTISLVHSSTEYDLPLNCGLVA
mmetsp:Transcript_2437/g.8720  ORF Transcript_2437/g.8720 Transcript_2437/m.8720 type:complete len:288 (+) Transcript_2437:3411-4274(+)